MTIAEYHRLSVEQGKMMVLGRLEQFAMPAMTKRPWRLPDDDEDLLERLREAKGSKKLADIETMREFGKWRADVFRDEAKACSNLVLLFSHLWHARENGSDDIAFELERFLANEYGVVFENMRPLEPETIRMYAEVYSRRHDVFSDRLMPESGLSKRHRKAPHGHPVHGDLDDDDGPEQLGIYQGLEG